MQLSELEISNIKKEIIEANDYVWLTRTSPAPGYDPVSTIERALENSLRCDFTYGEARSLLNLGMSAFIVKNDHNKAFEQIDVALQLFEELKDVKWLSNTYITRAIIRNSIGSPEVALYDGLKGIDYYQNNPTDPDLSMAFYVMGTILKDLKRYTEAEHYYKEGITHSKSRDMWEGRIYTSLSNIFAEQGNYGEALEYATKSLEILVEANNLNGQSRALNDIGCIYKKLGNNEKALENLFKALEIRKQNNLKHFILPSLIDIAEVYMQKGDMESATKFFLEAEHYGIETKHFLRLSSVYNSLAIIYKQKNDFRSLVSIYEKLIELNANASAKEREEKLNQSESKLLKEKEEEIERLKNIELKKAYEVIEQRNKDIHDSITYAKRIQDALLAQEDVLKQNLPEHFVYFEPKDIVSGDFYWATKRGDHFYLAVCDSTGHGVPGAFMSLLNIGFLSEAINEKGIDEPNEVLNFVRQRLIDNISKEGQKDGFDGILVKLECGAKEVVVKYSAANNIPIIIKNGSFIELEADRMPVGMGESSEEFKLFSVKANKGEMLYLYTDGYADQFGGPRGKKFKYKQLNELLQKIVNTKMDDQKNILARTFADWKGELEQIDDVCVVGIRL